MDGEYTPRFQMLQKYLFKWDFNGPQNGNEIGQNLGTKSYDFF